MKTDRIIVILKELRLTEHFTFQEIAILDKNTFLNSDGTLPKDKYMISYRVCQTEFHTMCDLYDSGDLLLTKESLDVFLNK